VAQHEEGAAALDDVAVAERRARDALAVTKARFGPRATTISPMPSSAWRSGHAPSAWQSSATISAKLSRGRERASGAMESVRSDTRRL
jgi:hypothetical protein